MDNRPKPAGAPRAPDDITSIKMRQALREGGCPVCRAAAETAYRFLQSFLHEQVNDPDVRTRLLASRGFCQRHAWQLTAFGDALGVAIVYRHLVQELTRDLQASVGLSLPAKRGRARGASHFMRQHRPCPLCSVIRDVEEWIVDSLLHRLDEEDVRERLEGDAGLCLPHLQLALDRAEDSGMRRKLASLQAGSYHRLLRHLDEFIRKHDYRFQHEGVSVEEGRSWTRAVEMLVGQDPLEARRRRHPWR